MAEAESPTRKRSRSPSYPGIDLGEALERAEALYVKEGRNAVYADTILEDWGYNPGSGGGLVALAALKKFGLLVEVGARGLRQARLSPQAIALIHETDPHEQRALIKEAALTPPIHAQLWKKYEGRLPTDSSMKRDLVLERNFTPRGVREFIPQFRETMKFAGLLVGDSMTATEDDMDEEQDLVSGQGVIVSGVARLTATGEVRTVPIPIGGLKTWPILQAPYPVSDEQWDELVDSVRKMKSAWTVSEPSEVEE